MFVFMCVQIMCVLLLQVFSAAVLGCVAALQQDMGMTPDLSPAWIIAAARHFSPRLDALLHILQIQPQLAPLILKQSLQADRPDMVRISEMTSNSIRDSYHSYLSEMSSKRKIKLI